MGEAFFSESDLIEKKEKEKGKRREILTGNKTKVKRQQVVMLPCLTGPGKYSGLDFVT